MLTLPIKQEWFDDLAAVKSAKNTVKRQSITKLRINSCHRPTADPNCKGQAYKIFPCKNSRRVQFKSPDSRIAGICIFGKGGGCEWGADPDKYYYILQILRYVALKTGKVEMCKDGNQNEQHPRRTPAL